MRCMIEKGGKHCILVQSIQTDLLLDTDDCSMDEYGPICMACFVAFTDPDALFMKLVEYWNSGNKGSRLR